MKQFFAAIIAFFTSLFSFGQPVPTPTPIPTTIATPLPTPAYPRATYENDVMNYQLLYPADTTIEESPDRQTSWDKKYTLRLDQYLGTDLTMEALLDTDLFCNADGPTGSISCTNTAIKPFTNQSGSAGFLIRRTKTVTGQNAAEYKDTAYVFPVNSPAGSAIILGVEQPTPENLQMLADAANWFTALP